MSLSKLVLPRLAFRPSVLVTIRSSGAFHGRELFDGKLDVKDYPAKIKVKLPGNPKGYYNYERNVSRDPQYKYQVPGNTIRRFLFGRFYETKNLWGLYFAVYILVPVFMVGIAIWSFLKIEVQVRHERYGAKIPGDTEYRSTFDWEVCKDNYWKQPKLLLHRKELEQRLPEMEALQDAMFEESVKRGTAKCVAFGKHDHSH